MHQLHAYRYPITLLRLPTGELLVVCLRCQHTLVACPTREDAIWVAAAHTVQGVG